MRYKSQFSLHSEVSRIFLRITDGLARGNSTWITICVFALPIILLLPSLWAFPYPASGSSFSDLTISHYPNAIYLRNAILTSQEIPLWSSTTLSGYPFVANPLSGLWYPVGWLALITPLPLGFNILVGLHLVWGGIGLYYLLRREGLEHIPALFAGIAFALLPKFFAHYGAGHLTLLYAVPWTPWLLLSQVSFIKHKRGWRRNRVPPGLILALIFLADVRWGVYATIIWWAYSIVHGQTKLYKTIFKVIPQSILALMLIAPMLLPMLEYSSLSTRSSLNPEEVLAYSLPVAQLVSLIFPAVNGYHEWVFYSGGIVLIFALAALSIRKIHRNELFWLAIILVSILFALGGQIPGVELLARLPIVNLLRVPSRSLFLAGLGLASLAGYGVDGLIGQPPLELTKRHKLIVFSLLAFSMILAAGIYVINKVLPLGILWGLGMLVIGIFWIGIRLRSKMPVQIWLIGLFLFAFIDLGFVDRFSFKAKAAEEVLNEGDEVARYISSQSGLYRTYSPSYSIPQHVAAQYELQLADGVDPLQLESYVDFMQEATGVPSVGYSVTMPPFEGGDPNKDNISYTPNARKLGIINVGFVVADYEINSTGLVLDVQFDDTRVYKNTQQMPRAWIQVLNNKNELEIKSVGVLEWTANRIVLSAKGPGTLILSEIDYPGWLVLVDGNVSQIHTFENILRAVQLDSRDHEVMFVFQPTSLLVGILVYLLGMIYLLGHLINVRRLN
jgi:hypothetical protein